MSNASSRLVFCGGGRERRLELRRHTRARRCRLSVDPRDGRVTLTLPPRASERDALAWVETRRSWVEAALDALPLPRPIIAGGTIPYRGAELHVGWDPALSRTVRHDGTALRFGGPEDAIQARVIAWLKREARAVLEEETRAIAGAAGVSVRRIAIGDPRTRWGSCSSGGDIRYSWRLILAPPAVLTATVAHEVAHRVHMHHGPEFHALVARLFDGDPAPERRWLRRHGAGLYWLGRGS